MSDVLTSFSLDSVEQTIGGLLVIEPPVKTQILATTDSGDKVVFTLDANLNEVEELSSDVTEYPVEDGGTMSDNISLKANQLSIDGVVTNMATDYIYSSALVGKAKFILAKSILKKLHTNRATVTVISGIDVYADMGITNIIMRRTAPKGQLEVSIRLKNIRKVTLQTVSSNAAAGKTASKSGATNTKATNKDDAPDATKGTQGTTILESLASKIKSGISSIFSN